MHTYLCLNSSDLCLIRLLSIRMTTICNILSNSLFIFLAHLSKRLMNKEFPNKFRGTLPKDIHVKVKTTVIYYCTLFDPQRGVTSSNNCSIRNDAFNYFFVSYIFPYETRYNSLLCVFHFKTSIKLFRSRYIRNTNKIK